MDRHKVASNLTFSLPYSTGMQLREIARHKGLSPAEVVAGWIRAELKASDFESAYNPVRVTFEPESGVLDLVFFGGECNLRLTLRQTEVLAKNIADMAQLGGTPTSLIDYDSSPSHGPFITMARHGAAFVLSIGTWRKTMSPKIALEIAYELAEGVSQKRHAAVVLSAPMLEELAANHKQKKAAERAPPALVKPPGRGRKAEPVSGPLTQVSSLTSTNNPKPRRKSRRAPKTPD